jgi:hypothetical protein
VALVLLGFSANGVNTIGLFDGNGLTVTGDATFTGDSSKNLFWDKSDGQLEFADNAKATFGTGSDLQIYHNGSHSIMSNATGQLHIKGDHIELQGNTAAEYLLRAIKDGAVELYHNNAKKLETSATGATVTGTLVADGLTVDTNVLHVDASSNRVGIKTTSPTEVLDLGQGSQINLKVGSRSFVGSGYSTNATILGHSVKSDTTNTVAGQMMVTETNSGGGAPSAIKQEYGIISFHTASSGTANAVFTSERMRIDSSGNLLVNVTTATAGSNTYKTLISDQIGSGEQLLGLQYEGTVTYGINAESDSSLTIKKDGTERMRIDSSGNVGIGDVDPDGNRLLVRAASTIGTVKGHIMLAGDSATNGQGPQIVFSESGSASEHAGAYIGHTRTGTNSVGNLVFATRATGGDANTIPTVALTISDSQNATFAGTVSDSIGNLRSIPAKDQGGASQYTLIASDAGKTVLRYGGGLTIPANVLTTGDAVTIINPSGSDITITQGSGITIYNSADATTGNRILAARGMATVWFSGGTAGYISGAGLS